MILDWQKPGMPLFPKPYARLSVWHGFFATCATSLASHLMMNNSLNGGGSRYGSMSMMSYNQNETSPPVDLKNVKRQVARIFTSNFPQYFAVITRCRQDVVTVGSEATVITSSTVDNAKIGIKAKSLLKEVNIGLGVQQIEDELVEEIMVQGGSVSPIVSIEPRRRKFHKAITITMPLPPRLRPSKSVNATTATATPSKSSLKSSGANKSISKGKLNAFGKGWA